jgi:hypothetical protein
MPVVDVRTFGETPSADIVSARRGKYVVPTLSRYGTLTDLTRHQGNKNGNDGNGPGCGNMNHAHSCLRP